MVGCSGFSGVFWASGFWVILVGFFDFTVFCGFFEFFVVWCYFRSFDGIEGLGLIEYRVL